MTRSGQALDFRRFMLSRALGSLCDQFLMFAVPLAILQETHSARLTATAFVIEWIPRVVGFPVVGALIDGLNLRRTFVFLDLGRVVALLLAAALLHTTGTFATLSALMACMSIGYVTNFLGIEAVIPNNLEPSRFPAAHSTVQAVEQGSQVLGPALAAVLYQHDGITLVLLVCAGVFALSALNTSALFFKDSSHANTASIKSAVATNLLAVRTLMERPSVFYLSGMTWVVNLVFGTTLAIAAAVVVQYFARSSATFGLMQSSAAVAAIAVFGVVPFLTRRLGVAAVGRFALIAMITAGLVLGLAPAFVPFAVGYCVLNAFDGVFNVYVRTMRSTILPKEHLGKVMGIVGAINLLSIPLGGLVASVLSATLPLPRVILVSTALAVVLCLALILVGKFKLGYRDGFPAVPVG
ncbi:MAG: MFS transporter [Segniliparus sp.]|uniref:MFS transporter n=1 Tax=Segniliparus sp. TaxID=2804064 RepID=UPI003F361CFD